MDLRESMLENKRHPWELSRADCLFNIVKKHHLNTAADIGAGDGFFIKKLASVIAGGLYAVDAGYAEKETFSGGIHYKNDISLLPEPAGGGGSGIILMDVLEHVEDDAAFLDKILEKTPEDGLIIITVPAFQFLFSAHDLFLKHYRRYNRKTLRALLARRVHIEKCHYFYASLFLARAAGFFIKRKQLSGIGTWRFSETSVVTRFIRAVLNFDFYLCAFLARFHFYPPGLSLLAVCRKTRENRHSR
ncbi:MAG: class I SAM-dependent methyltransferase [Spirochaetaceae bacterium]|jgi:hypothetical protein|nr:class I SAM-dependent methyltransferase [Spirochaetaceae bacterium]